MTLNCFNWTVLGWYYQKSSGPRIWEYFLTMIKFYYGYFCGICTTTSMCYAQRLCESRIQTRHNGCLISAPQGLRAPLWTLECWEWQKHSGQASLTRLTAELRHSILDQRDDYAEMPSHGFSRLGVPKFQDLMPDDLRWNWMQAVTIQMKHTINVTCLIIQNPPPLPVEKLSSTKLVPGAKKIGGPLL